MREVFKKHIQKQLLFIICLILLVLLLLPYFFAPSPGQMLLNQHYIESLDAEYDAASLSEQFQRFLSTYTYAWNSLFHRPSNAVNFSDVDAMFGYLFGHLPYYTIVYPTEYYYYYLFEVPGHMVSGNLRFVEIDNGKIGMGYFDKDEQSLFHHKLFSAQDGLEIEKKSSSLYKLTYRGKTIYVRLPVDIAREQPTTLQVLPEETFVAKIREESGIIFYLYFNTLTNSFYYILDEERPVTESLLPLPGTNIFMGNRTAYAYYQDHAYNRKLLFGIADKNRELNNYFDGPFDQVPPFLHLRDMIYKAYPYTQFGSGVDLYGNFIDRTATRVAISPYYDYVSLDELLDLVADCERETQGASLLWSCLTYEDKKDYHKDSPLFYANGTLRANTNSSKKSDGFK